MNASTLHTAPAVQAIRRPFAPADESSAPWLAAMLDEIDYPMLLLVDHTRVLHANKAARHELDEEHPLRLVVNELRARSSADAAPLNQAIEAATTRGLRRLLALGKDGSVCVAVVPLGSASDDNSYPTLLVFSKRHMCEELSVQWFARSNGLTLTETQVLQALCNGLQPQQVALRQGVALSTVRTHIGAIRSKTGADSIRDLVRRIATLPPLVNTLHRGLAN